MTKVCMHSFVSGKVQGVWYRDTAKRRARKMGLTGWVKNLADGRVEVFACGAPDIIDEYQQWLWKGSPLSKVSEVESTEVTYQEFDDFSVHR